MRWLSDHISSVLKFGLSKMKLLILISLSLSCVWSPREVLAIFIYAGVCMKDKTETQKNGFTVNFTPKNIVIMHIFYPKIWATIFF